MTYVKIQDKQMEAAISGKLRDSEWGNRESKAITCGMTYQEALELFTEDRAWFIVYQADSHTDENGETVTPEPVVYDNSDYCVPGPITDNRDGTVTVKMGKPTAAELLAVLMGG